MPNYMHAPLALVPTPMLHMHAPLALASTPMFHMLHSHAASCQSISSINIAATHSTQHLQHSISVTLNTCNPQPLQHSTYTTLNLYNIQSLYQGQSLCNIMSILTMGDENRGTIDNIMTFVCYHLFLFLFLFLFRNKMSLLFITSSYLFITYVLL